MGQRIPTNTLIERAKLIHNNKYDYSLVDKLPGIMIPRTIICPIHGEFKQSFNSHINDKKGCKKCGNIIAGKKCVIPIHEFLIRANKIHNNKYDYSKVKYNTLHDKIIIICPIHGEFKQTASNHLQKSIRKGCRKCTLLKKTMTQDQFIDRSNKIHKHKYDYSKVKYKNGRNKVKIKCPIHGIFEQQPSHHLRGNGCIKCRTLNKFLSRDEVIKRFIKVHGNKYDYSKFIYTGRFKRAIFICPKHGEFEQFVDVHLLGSGCRFCHESKGERKVRLWLENKNIGYEPQKKFDTCLGYRNRKLPFDFYIPSKNILIEYDGNLHYKAWNKKVKNIKRLKRLQQTDKIKTDWCLQNNIKLIRINYKQFDKVEKILESNL